MAARAISTTGETEEHVRLKRLAFLWAQGQGYSACALEVTLPKCSYRADVAAYRAQPKQIGSTAIFECKQALCNLRRDNCDSEAAHRHFEAICKRRQILETGLRAHYPNLQTCNSLFPEFDPETFSTIGHRGYARLLRKLRTLQNRLYDCTKFDKLVRYRCANLFFLVLPQELFRDPEVPAGWGALVESNSALTLVREPVWHEAMPQSRLDLLQRIATAGTRHVNREFGITFEQVQSIRSLGWV